MAEHAIGRQTPANPAVIDPLNLRNANLPPQSRIILRGMRSEAKACHLRKNQTTVQQEKQFEKAQRKSIIFSLNAEFSVQIFDARPIQVDIVKEICVQVSRHSSNDGPKPAVGNNLKKEVDAPQSVLAQK